MKKEFIALFLLFVCSCNITNNITGNTVTERKDISIDVYFCPRDKCMEQMIEKIDKSSEIKCAFYDLDLPNLIDLLKEKGAEVIIEDKNRLPHFRSNYSYGLMHNKFCVLDKKKVITGSLNPTERGNYYNNNNIIILESRIIAENYLDEFEELWNGDFGKGVRTKNKVIYYKENIIKNYFCPEDNCKLQVIKELEKAESSIYFMTFTFTDKDIGNLLWNKDYLGLDVKGILEERQIGRYSRYEDLKKFSTLDKNKYNMHHKVFIIDNKTVITGSYNPTESANERNDENILIIYDRRVAEKYVEEFEKLYNMKTEIPGETKELILSKVLYNAEGSDKNKEEVILKNTGNATLDLDYYFISDNESEMRLLGNLLPKKTRTIKPKFTLKNSNDVLILKKHQDIIDIVSWGNELLAEEGEYLIRNDEDIVNNAAWT